MKPIFVAALVATGYSAACTIGGSAVAAQGGGFVSASAITSACTCGGGSATAATPSCSSGRCVVNAGSSATKGICQTAANYAIITTRTTQTNAASCSGGTGVTCASKLTAFGAATSGNCGWHASSNPNGFLLGTVGWFNCMGPKMAGVTNYASSEATKALAWGSKAVGAAACTIGGSAVAAQNAGFVSASALTVPCICGATAATAALPICDGVTGGNVRCVQNAATSATKGSCQTAANYAIVTARTTATTAATCAGSAGTTCGGKETAAIAGTSGNCGYDASNNAGAALKGTAGWFTCMAGKMGNSGLAAGAELTNADAWAMAASGGTACTIASSAVAAQGGGFLSASALTTACICGGTTSSAAKPICSTGARCVQDLGSSPTKGVCQTAANYALITAKTTALTSAISSACTGSGTTTCGGILALAAASASATGCKWHTSTLTAGSLVGTVAYWDCVAGKLRAFAALSGTPAAEKTAALAYSQAVTPTSAPTAAPATTAVPGSGPASIASIAAASITAVVAALL